MTKISKFVPIIYSAINLIVICILISCGGTDLNRRPQVYDEGALTKKEFK